MLNEILTFVMNRIGDFGIMTEAYSGQLEDGAEWTPEFPCALVDISGGDVTLRDANNFPLSFSAVLNVYVGLKAKDAGNGINILDMLADALCYYRGFAETYHESTYIGFERIGFRQGGVTVYRMKFSVGYRSEIA